MNHPPINLQPGRQPAANPGLWVSRSILFVGIAGVPLTALITWWALSRMPEGDGPGVYVAFITKAAVGAVLVVVGLAISISLIITGAAVTVGQRFDARKREIKAAVRQLSHDEEAVR